MKLIAPALSNFVQNRKANWRRPIAAPPWIEQREPAMRPISRCALQKKPDGKNIPPELCVEDIEVYVDGKYMYCRGMVRSHGSGARSNLVVAIEWLDENRRALNTEWQRLEMQRDGQTVPLFPNAMRSFVVKAPLDRRVKWVKAYAFAGKN